MMVERRPVAWHWQRMPTATLGAGAGIVPVKDTWYTVVATARSVRVRSIKFKHTNNEAAVKAIDVRLTLDGNVVTITDLTENNSIHYLTLDATGYNVYSLYNRTTGERIFLNGLRVYTGEKIELIFSPTGYTITSNVRGDMRSSVLSGSSPTFHLQPGDNYVSCFVYPSPAAAVTIPLKYPAQNYISLDETVYA